MENQGESRLKDAMLAALTQDEWTEGGRERERESERVTEGERLLRKKNRRIPFDRSFS
jgi:hypothetical protein